ncbi:MAG: HAD-superfamily subfamily hydrolase, hypothetical 3:HAD-superfamily hydrolase, subfamily [Rickettsiales bacterium]|nr:HAD-superfamily subfamily hydrolase, hypothetical 3:HAD-superfamily hydrolase, subfamily [Rickettsiales bacterium]
MTHPPTKASVQAIQPYSSIRECIDQYDAFIVDLWGVIHDGMALYSGAHETLEYIHKAGKRVIFLSNAPRRAWRSQANLTRMGVAESLYDAMITSGEVAFRWFESGASPYPKDAYFMTIGPERDDGILDGLPYTRTADASKASFMIATGYDADDSPLDEKQAQLDAGLARKLPMICVNPDIIVVRHSGVEVPCAGILADQYKAMGGEVIYFGKPYPQVYETCFELFQHRGITDQTRIAAIGDNLHTDIKGANALQLDSFLIAGGILGKRLGITHGESPSVEKLAELCEEEGGIYPKAVLPAFI